MDAEMAYFSAFVALALVAYSKLAIGPALSRWA